MFEIQPYRPFTAVHATDLTDSYKLTFVAGFHGFLMPKLPECLKYILKTELTSLIAFVVISTYQSQS